MMRIKGLGRLKQKSKKWWRRKQPRALILLYHRIDELESDPQLLSVSPHHFAEQLQIISQQYHPISLQKLVENLSQGQVPHRSIAITFDDGYSDNLHQAKPLLEHYQIPATVFVTAGQVGQSQEFWWDDLERLLLQARSLPENLSITIQGKTKQWQLGDSAHYTEQQYQQNRHWNVSTPDAPTARHQIYRDLCSILRPLPIKERQYRIQELTNWSGSDRLGRATHRSLTPEEVKQLAAGGLIEVGAHTMTHPVLSAIPKAEQHNEIQQSKAHLESILGQPVTSFAYPYGGKPDYNLETVATVQEANFACACSTFVDAVWQDADCFQLPRVLIRNWTGEEFALRLQKWFSF